MHLFIEISFLLFGTFMLWCFIQIKKERSTTIILTISFYSFAGVVYYMDMQNKIADAQYMVITNDSDISNTTKVVLPLDVAKKIDVQYITNANCDTTKCIYTGNSFGYGGHIMISLLSQQNLTLDCTVENNCHLSAYVEHGVKMLNVSFK